MQLSQSCSSYFLEWHKKRLCIAWTKADEQPMEGKLAGSEESSRGSMHSEREQCVAGGGGGGGGGEGCHLGLAEEREFLLTSLFNTR